MAEAILRDSDAIEMLEFLLGVVDVGDHSAPMRVTISAAFSRALPHLCGPERIPDRSANDPPLMPEAATLASLYLCSNRFPLAAAMRF